MDNNSTERRSINLSKNASDTGKSSMREAYPRYSSDENAQDLQRKEYRNSTQSTPYSAPAYKSMPEQRNSYSIPPVQPQTVSKPLAGYQRQDNLNHYYDSYSGQNAQQTYSQPQQTYSQPQPVQQTATKFCKFCGERIPSDAVVCTHCGRQVETLNGSAQYTSQAPVNNMINIGQQTPQYPVGMVSEKSKSTSLILAALGFFGVAGLHRLYAGKIISGLLYLFTGGLCMVGTLVDILKLASNTFTDGTGAIIKK